MKIHSLYYRLSILVFSFFLLSNVSATENDSLHIQQLTQNYLKKNVDLEIVTPSYIQTYIQIPELTTEHEQNHSYQFTTLNFSEFTDHNLQAEYPQDEEVAKGIALAQETLAEVEANHSWVGSFGDEDLAHLPIGITHNQETQGGNDNIEYTVAIAKAFFTAEYTELTAFVRIRLPQSDDTGLPRELFFGADNLKLSHEGGVIGDWKLVLLGDVNIPFNNNSWLLRFKGGYDYTSGHTNQLTYVTLDCEGVKELSLEGQVQFSRKMIVPMKENFTPDLREEVTEGGITFKNRVRGDFSIKAKSFNDLLVEIDLQPFMLTKQVEKGHGAFGFTVNKAIFDFSDFRNDSDVQFPQRYQDYGLLLPTREAWRGVYIKTLEVALPTEFKTKETISNNRPVTFGSHNLLIDNYGVSGTFYADNIFPLKEGRTGEQKAWAYSLDHIGIELAATRLVGAEFDGRILLPVSRADSNQENASSKPIGLAYSGLISEDEYRLHVKTDSVVDFNIWKAKATLLPNSSIEFKVVEGVFKPKATLNGSLAITANQKKENEEKPEESSQSSLVDFKGIVFERLVLQTESPVFQADYFGYEGDVQFANFPVSFSRIYLTANEYETALGFDVQVNLMGKEDKGFAAEGAIVILGNYQEKDFQQHWEYAGMDIDRFFINANIGPVAMSGELNIMENDPEYGNGFQASVTGTFGKFGPIEAQAIFGKKDFRYWYVDAAVHGLGIEVGSVEIDGFAGGAYYKMNRKDFSSNFSPSGLAYTPNDEIGLGVKAMVFGGLVKKEAVGLGAGFEITTTSSGGVARAGFYGYASIMEAMEFANPVQELTKQLEESIGSSDALQDIADSKLGKRFLDKAKESSSMPSKVEGQAGIRAYLGMEQDFQNDVFHAELDVFVDVASGIIRGRASKNRAGWAVFHSSKNENYLYVGTPYDRLGLEMGVGPIRAEAGGYFMIGDKIPASPPPPPIVANILGVDAKRLDYMRDENALGEGRGFAFGSDFSVDTGDLTFLFLYARFQAGAGFDIMLKDYGEAQCLNNNQDQIGINGWYANGQAYAYLQGELGIKIKLFFIRKKIPIIKGGAAVLLQAKAPNPVWMRGYVGGHYNILGGMIKGRFRFKLELGEECELANASPLGGIKMITSVAPKDGDREVDVFAAPQATFAMRVNEPIMIPEDDGDKTYRVILEHFNVADQQGKTIEGKLEWNRTKDVATFISHDILPPNTQLKAKVQVSFQEQINGVFKIIEVNGQKALETEEQSFTTGGAPNIIPLHNIEYAYPVINQQNFYPEEANKGYITLQRGQDYLFEDENWVSEIFYANAKGEIQQIPFDYNTTENQIHYTLPQTQKETQYHISITSYVKGNEVNTEAVVNTKEEDLGDGNTIETSGKEASVATNSNVTQIERLAYNFRVSQYPTFANKIQNLKTSANQWGKIASDVIYLKSKIGQNEAFDLVELVGNSYTQDVPMVAIEANLNHRYYTQDIAPILYNKYPIEGKFYVDRDDNLKDEYETLENVGVPPKRALPILNSYLSYLENEIRQDWLKTTFPYYYNLPVYYKADMVELTNKVANFYANNPSSVGADALKVLQARYPFMRAGQYKVKLQYILPGGQKGTTATYNFKNELQFRPE